MINCGPRLVIAQHKETGAVSPDDIAEIVDEILIPALTCTRVRPGAANGHREQLGIPKPP